MVRMRALVEAVADRRAWVLGAPEFVDDTDEGGLRTVGCLMRLCAVEDPVGARIDREVDEAHLAEVTYVLDELRVLSEQLDVEIGVELDRDSVGWIASGVLDEGLRDGLLGEWQRGLSP